MTTVPLFLLCLLCTDGRTERYYLCKAQYRQFNIQPFYVLPTHTVFICFVWIGEQTAIMSLYSTNWMVFLTESESVYCAVRTGSLTVIQVYCSIHSVKRKQETPRGPPHSFLHWAFHWPICQNRRCEGNVTLTPDIPRIWCTMPNTACYKLLCDMYSILSCTAT